MHTEDDQKKKIEAVEAKNKTALAQAASNKKAKAATLKGQK